MGSDWFSLPCVVDPIECYEILDGGDHRQLSLQLVRHADHRALGDVDDVVGRPRMK